MSESFYQDQPVISVIIPTFNRLEATIKSIESVFKQTYKNIEVIVVDDCSTDGSFEKLNVLLGNKIILLQNHENSGAGTGRNLGVDNCSGNYIAFLDSDDEWLPTKLDEQYNLLVSCYEKNALVYAPANLVHNNQPIVVNPSRALSENERVEDYIFFSKQDIQTSGWFMSKEFFQKVRFTDKLKRHQDWDFVLRAQELGCKFIFAPNVLYVRNGGDKSQHVGTFKLDGLTEAWLLKLKKIVPAPTYHKIAFVLLYDAYLAISPLKTFPLIINAFIDGCFYFGKLKYSVLKLLRFV